MPRKWLINGKENRKRGEDTTAEQTDEEGIPSISLSTAEIHDLGFARRSLSFFQFSPFDPLSLSLARARSSSHSNL